NVPMMEFTACPPNAGKLSARMTLRPRAAASSAAETPAIPAPTTQMSAVTAWAPRPPLCTIRVAVEKSRLADMWCSRDAFWITQADDDCRYEGTRPDRLTQKHRYRAPPKSYSEIGSKSETISFKMPCLRSI